MEHLSQLVTFVRVVEAGGFTAAARRLGISKGTVSKQLKALEDRLGAQLLVRTSRQLRLTEAGSAYYARAAAVAAEAEAAEEAVSELQREPRGRLRVSAPASLGARYLAPLLPDFLTRHPGLEVDLSLEDRVVDLVAERIDLAVRITRMADSSLVARRLAPTRLVVVGSPAYLSRRGVPDHPEALGQHDCLTYSYQASGDSWVLAGSGHQRASVRVQGRLESNSGDALLLAAEGGLGLALLPDFIAGPALAEGRVVQVLPDWHGENTGVFAVYPPGRYVSAKVRAFVDHLVAAFAEGPPWALGPAGGSPPGEEAQAP